MLIRLFKSDFITMVFISRPKSFWNFYAVNKVTEPAHDILEKLKTRFITSIHTL